MKKKILLPIIIAVVAVALIAIVAITIYTGKYGKNAPILEVKEEVTETVEEVKEEVTDTAAAAADGRVNRFDDQLGLLGAAAGRGEGKALAQALRQHTGERAGADADLGHAGEPALFLFVFDTV